MNFFKPQTVPSLLILILIALGLRLAFFSISVANAPESSDESLSILQAKMIVENGHTPLLVMANPYQFPVESYLHAPFVKFLPRNAFGARGLPFLLCLAATVIFIAALFLIAPLKTNWPALLLLLFPSAYILMLNSAYFIPQHSSFALLGALAFYLSFRMRNSAAPAITAFLAGFCAGLAFSNHILALPLLAVLGAYAALGPRISIQLRIIPAFAAGVAIGLVPYLLAVWLIPGAYGAVSGTIPLTAALKRLWEPALSSALTGVMGINPCLFPDNRHTLTLIPGFGKIFAVIWILILAAVTALRTARFIRRMATTRSITLEANDVLTGLAWLGFFTFLFSARALSHTYRYLLPVAWVFPFLVACLYARAPKTGRILIGGFAVFLAGYNIIASLALMREWAQPGFAEKEAQLFDLKPALDYLEKRSIRHAYASYWLAYRLTYETGGRILCSQPINERFPGWPMPYKRQVDAAGQVAYILAPKTKFEPRHFENDLAAMDVACRQESLGALKVYTDFSQKKTIPAFPLPGGQVRVALSHEQSAAAALIDDNPRTFWQVTNAYQKELWIQLELPQPESISRIVISHAGFPDEFVGLSGIMGQTETGWTKVVADTAKARDRFEYRNGHPVYSEDALTFTFPPFQTGALRLMLHGPTKHCQRVIGDIKLFRSQL